MKKKLLSALMVIALLISCGSAQAVFAAPAEVEPDLIVTTGGVEGIDYEFSDDYYGHKALFIKSDRTDYVISMREGVQRTSYLINISADATVTLDNVTNDYQIQAYPERDSDSFLQNVTLRLLGKNHVRYIYAGDSLTIENGSGDPDNPGVLQCYTIGRGAEDVRSLTLKSGIVRAWGEGDIAYTDDQYIFYPGILAKNVRLTGESRLEMKIDSGISSNFSDSEIIIEDNAVVQSNSMIEANNIHITDNAKVEINVGTDPAGIYRPEGNWAFPAISCYGGQLEISGNANVTAVGNSGAAGIEADDITISENAVVVAKGGDFLLKYYKPLQGYFAGPGAGIDSGLVTIRDNAVVSAFGGAGGYPESVDLDIVNPRPYNGAPGIEVESGNVTLPEHGVLAVGGQFENPPAGYIGAVVGVPIGQRGGSSDNLSEPVEGLRQMTYVAPDDQEVTLSYIGSVKLPNTALLRKFDEAFPEIPGVVWSETQGGAGNLAGEIYGGDETVLFAVSDSDVIERDLIVTTGGVEGIDYEYLENDDGSTELRIMGSRTDYVISMREGLESTPYRLWISVDATVALDNVVINDDGNYYGDYPNWPRLNTQGDVTIRLIGKNKVSLIGGYGNLTIENENGSGDPDNPGTLECYSIGGVGGTFQSITLKSGIVRASGLMMYTTEAYGPRNYYAGLCATKTRIMGEACLELGSQGLGIVGSMTVAYKSMINEIVIEDNAVVRSKSIIGSNNILITDNAKVDIEVITEPTGYNPEIPYERPQLYSALSCYGGKLEISGQANVTAIGNKGAAGIEGDNVVISENAVVVARGGEYVSFSAGYMHDYIAFAAAGIDVGYEGLVSIMDNAVVSAYGGSGGHGAPGIAVASGNVSLPEHGVFALGGERANYEFYGLPPYGVAVGGYDLPEILPVKELRQITYIAADGQEVTLSYIGSVKLPDTALLRQFDETFPEIPGVVWSESPYGTGNLAGEIYDGEQKALFAADQDAEITYVQENSEYLTFSDGWGNRAQIGKFSGHVAKQASKLQEHMSFTFKGNYFELLSYKSYSQGMFDIYVDGEKMNAQPYDLYDPSTGGSFQQVVGGMGLPYGEHTVTLVIVGRNKSSIGNNVYVDAVGINGELISKTGGKLTDDEVMLENGNPAYINVLMNDDVPYDTAITEYTQPENGSVQFENGVFVFTPETMYPERDFFTYTIGDKTATVNIVYAETVRYEETFALVEAGKGEDNAWENASFRSYSGGGALRSNKQGDTITLTFYGRGIEIIGYKSWSRGKLDVTLDGVTETVSCFDMSYDKTYNTAIYDSGDLGSSGWHTLTLTVRGDKDFLASSTAIDIDAFVVKRFPPTIVN